MALKKLLTKEFQDIYYLGGSETLGVLIVSLKEFQGKLSGDPNMSISEFIDMTEVFKTRYDEQTGVGK